jgi:hypothetical protein
MPRQVRPKRKSSPQGEENMPANVKMTQEDRADAAYAYRLRELNEIKDNALLALKKAKEAAAAATAAAERPAPRSKGHIERVWAQMERDEMIRDMPSLPKLRKKTRSVTKSKRRSRTRKHKTL